jgi:hypothetical protein
MTPKYAPAQTGMRDDMVSLKIETVYDAVGKIVDKYYLTAKKVKDIYVSDFENIKTLAGKIIALNVSDEDILKASQIALDTKKLTSSDASVTLTEAELTKVKTNLYSNAITEATEIANQIKNIASKSFDEEKKNTNTVVVSLADAASTSMTSISTNSTITAGTDSTALEAARKVGGIIVGLAENAISSLNAIIESQTSPVIVNDLWSTKDAKIEMLNKKNIYLEDYNTSLKAENKSVRENYNTANTKLIQKTADYEVEKAKATNTQNSLDELNNGIGDSFTKLQTSLDKLNTLFGDENKGFTQTLNSVNTSIEKSVNSFSNVEKALEALMPTYQVHHLNADDNNIFSQFERVYLQGQTNNI